MSIDPTIAMLYAQTGYTARVAHDAVTGPQAAVAMSRVLAQEMVKQEQQQVQRMQNTGEARVATDDSHEGSGQMPFGSRRRNRPPRPEPETDEPSPPDTPLVGNLLNLKV